MGGQQAESAYARVDYVDGKFREHDKKHKADMDGIKVSFEQAAEKYNELKEQVIGLKAVVESLQTIIALSQNNGASCDSDKVGEKKSTKVGRPPLIWMSVGNMTKHLREKYAINIKYGDLSRSLKWAGYIEEGSDGGLSHPKVTEKGAKLGWLRNRITKTCHIGTIEINPKYVDDCLNIFKEYDNFFKNAQRDN